MKQINPYPFIADRFVGGDDPKTVITALTNLNAKLEAHNVALHHQKLNLWTPLAILIQESGGTLRVKRSLTVSETTGIVIDHDSEDPDLMVLRLQECEATK